MGLKSDLQEKFNWHLVNKFSIAQQEVILAAGQLLLLFLDQQTAGRGKAWMTRNIGRVNFYHGGLPHKVVTLANHGTPTSVTFLKRTIWLEPTFEQSANPIQHVIHEVAHVIDNVAGSHEHALLSIWFGHGPSDQLALKLGGKPRGLRWQNGSCRIRKSFRWSTSDPGTQFGYGNHSTADFFAEAFAWTVVDPLKIKPLLVRKLISEFILDK